MVQKIQTLVMILLIVFTGALSACSSAPKEVPRIYIYHAETGYFVRDTASGDYFPASDPKARYLMCTPPEDAKKIASGTASCSLAFDKVMQSLGK